MKAGRRAASHASANEVGSDTRSFPRALRQALRQDPDVIVVSELRDLDTIRIALTAAETGHLVLATLHTPDAPQTIDRIVDVFPADQQAQVITQLSGALEGIVCQRLIKSERSGMVPAVEVMINTHTVSKLLENNKIETIAEAVETGGDDGMQSFNQSILGLIRGGFITEEEGMKYATNPGQLRMSLQGINLNTGRRILMR